MIETIVGSNMTNDNTMHDGNCVLIAIKYDTISVTDMQFINKRVHVSLFLQFKYHFKQHFLISHIKRTFMHTIYFVRL